MTLNLPNILTLLRLILIPVMVIVYLLDFSWSHLVSTIIFVIAAITDWLDGYLARRLKQDSKFGAFLDPVADKLIVAVALVLLATDKDILQSVWSVPLFTCVISIILCREIIVSALREWMAEIGKRGNVAVSYIGKVKTTFQMIAISLLLYQIPFKGLPILKIGELLLIIAAVLTLWSMYIYLKATWPYLKDDA